MLFPYPSLDGVIVHLRRRYSLVIVITLDFLHPISRDDCPIISYYQPLLDVCRFAL